jgi:hypothetical protein
MRRSGASVTTGGVCRTVKATNFDTFHQAGRRATRVGGMRLEKVGGVLQAVTEIIHYDKTI